jgi:hypothetical protein
MVIPISAIDELTELPYVFSLPLIGTVPSCG